MIWANEPPQPNIVQNNRKFNRQALGIPTHLHESSWTHKWFPREAHMNVEYTHKPRTQNHAYKESTHKQPNHVSPKLPSPNPPPCSPGRRPPAKGTTAPHSRFARTTLQLAQCDRFSSPSRAYYIGILRRKKKTFRRRMHGTQSNTCSLGRWACTAHASPHVHDDYTRDARVIGS